MPRLLECHGHIAPDIKTTIREVLYREITMLVIVILQLVGPSINGRFDTIVSRSQVFSVWTYAVSHVLGVEGLPPVCWKTQPEAWD